MPVEVDTETKVATDRVVITGPSPVVLDSVVIPARLSAFKMLESDRGTIQVQDLASLKERANRLSERGVQLIAVRHGESEANASVGAMPLSGRGDSPLTEKGRQQAKAAALQMFEQLGGANWLQGAAADSSKLPVLFSSPMSRAADTGKALCAVLQKQAAELCQKGRISQQDLERVNQVGVQTIPELQEIDFGQCEGQDAREVGKTYPNFAKGLDFVHRFPGGESGIDVLTRVDSFLERVEEQMAGRTVIFFAHTMPVGLSQVLLGQASHDDKGCLFVDRSKIPNAAPVTLTKAAAVPNPSDYLIVN